VKYCWWFVAAADVGQTAAAQTTANTAPAAPPAAADKLAPAQEVRIACCMTDSTACPLRQEAEGATLHLLGKCCALINQRLEILRSHCLEYEDLALLHWRSLLRLAKASRRF